MRAGSFLAGAAAILVTAFGSRAESPSVRLNLRGETGRVVEGMAVAKAADGKAGVVERPFRCDAGRECLLSLDLPDGPTWLISVGAPGFWSTPESTTIGGAVDFWPSGTVRGEVRTAKGVGAATEIGMRFASSPGADFLPAFPTDAFVTCPVSDGKFSCEMPAGTFDLRLRVKGHVSVYRWGQKLRPGQILDLGSMELHAGASVVGQVISDDREAPNAASCTVRLESPTGPDPKQEKQMGLPRVPVDFRGFFHLANVPPGSWVVVAEQDGFVPARRTVKVIENMEATLKDPLALSRPAKLEVTLLPPQDPAGQAWVVEVAAERSDERYESVASAPASLGGAWSRERLASGQKTRVRVRTASGQVWWVDERPFTLTGPVHRRTIDLGYEEIRGSVKLGEAPLEAILAFGAPKEMISIGLRSGPDGVISGALPRVGEWHVVVTSERPPVHRELDVEVRKAEDGRGRVEIVLRDLALVGEIVDEGGQRLDRAILTIRSASTREDSQEVVDGGAFRLTGFEKGQYLLSAEGRGVVSDMVPAEIASDGSSEFVRIVARPKNQAKLLLVSEGGAPLPGAKATILTTTQFPGIQTMFRKAGADGRVTFSTHPDTRQQCFAVSFPGLSTVIAAVAPGPEESRVAIPQDAGTLVIEGAGQKSGQSYVLWRGGCFVPLALLERLASASGRTFQGLAPGDYRLCRYGSGSAVGSPSCASGFLAPRGTLSLKVEATTP